MSAHDGFVRTAALPRECVVSFKAFIEYGVIGYCAEQLKMTLQIRAVRLFNSMLAGTS